MNSIYDDIKFLKGVGEKRAHLLQKMGIHTILDLMEFFPRNYINRQASSKIENLEIGRNVSFIGEIAAVEFRQYATSRKQLNVTLTDGKEFLLCTWFQTSKLLPKQFEPHKKLWVSGLVTLFLNNKQIIHPEIELLDDEEDTQDFWHKRPILPVYRLTENVKMKMLRKYVYTAFQLYHEQIVENLPDEILTHFFFIERKKALQIMHFTTQPRKAEKVFERFIFEELFYHQLMLCRSRAGHHAKQTGFAFTLHKTLTSRLKKRLPFELTKAQKKVLNEIVTDMISPVQMNRLLQGDVGSGKTIVVLFAMLIAIENGFQALLMAPTEILAEQHFKTIKKLLESEKDVSVILLKGGIYKGKESQKQAIAKGEAQLIIGTHALLQSDVTFSNVGFIAIDEQHRFGVEQRSIISQKGNNPDILHLSATPIPRSLALTVYGDLDSSILDELPPYRKSIQTMLLDATQKAALYERTKEFLIKGNQMYVVCPLVEESEKLDLLDAERVFQELAEFVYPDYSLALLHGRMKPKEKDDIMESFQNGEIHILVSTTVIEVGIDVPNATIMIIEHAERFGLSQLHQLRGRIGRGEEQSYCFLIAHEPVGAIARERLQCMIETNDGFKIAEKDLQLRGPGDFFGTMQSGMPEFKFANLVRDRTMLFAAREIAEFIVKDDYDFAKERNKIIRDHYELKYKNKEKLFDY
jgi:ATP-dependent DNA helicase RecG